MSLAALPLDIYLANVNRSTQTPFSLLAALGLLALASGCGGSSSPSYDDFEVFQFREEMTETSLGHFSVPVPLIVSGDEASNRIQFQFELFGVVKPEAESRTLRLAERHKGQLRDRVIRVCRNARIEDLLDPQLSTLRSRLLDTIQPLLDGVAVDRVLVVVETTEPL